MPGNAEKPPVRFLELALEGSFRHHVQTPAGMLEHFPPDGLMADILKERPQMRANVLTSALNMEGDFLTKLGPYTAGDLLQTAYEAGEADAGKIVEANTYRAWAEVIPQAALWNFISGREWWRNPDDGERQYLQFLLEAILAHDFLPTKDYLDQLSPKELAPALSKNKLEELFADAAITGHRNEPFHADRVFKIVGVPDFFDGLPPEYLFERIVRRTVDRLGILRSQTILEGSPETAAAMEQDVQAIGHAPGGEDAERILATEQALEPSGTAPVELQAMTDENAPETTAATPASKEEEEAAEAEAGVHHGNKKRRGKTTTLKPEAAVPEPPMQATEERPIEHGWSAPPNDTHEAVPSTKSYGPADPDNDSSAS